MAQNNLINGQQQQAAGSASLVEQFLQEQSRCGDMSKASLRSQLVKVQNRIDKTRDKVDKCNLTQRGRDSACYERTRGSKKRC